MEGEEERKKERQTDRQTDRQKSQILTFLDLRTSLRLKPTVVYQSWILAPAL